MTPETETDNPILQAALDYASRRLRVVPARARTKIPDLLGKGWQNKATADEATIRSWWETHPQANVGVAVGPGSGIVIIDCDSTEAERWVSEHIFGGEPVPAPRFTSPGGTKFIFKYRNDLPQKASIKIKNRSGEPIGDIKIGHGALGSFVVMPPSAHPSGATYAWQQGCSFDDIDPPELSERALAAIAALDLEGTLYEPRPSIRDGVDQGSRNVAAAQFVGGLAGHSDKLDGETREQLWEETKSWNTANRPPLPISELKRTFDSIVDKELRNRGDDGRRNGLDFLRRMLDLPTLTGVKQYGRRDADFELEFAGPSGAETIDLGGIKQIGSISHVRACILEATRGQSCTKMDKKAWPQVVQAILQTAVLIETPDEITEFSNEILRMEAAWNLNRGPMCDSGDYWQSLKFRLLNHDSMVGSCGRHPEDNSLMLKLPTLKRWLIEQGWPFAKLRRIPTLLRKLGFVDHQLSVRNYESKVMKVRLWRSPKEWRLEELREQPTNTMHSITGERPRLPAPDPGPDDDWGTNRKELGYNAAI